MSDRVTMTQNNQLNPCFMDSEGTEVSRLKATGQQGRETGTIPQVGRGPDKATSYCAATSAKTGI